MKKWNAPEVAELNINETADGLFPAMYEGIFGDCLCGNDDNHGPLTGHNCPNQPEEDGKDSSSTDKPSCM